LHPLVAIPTLLFGIITGSKLTLLLALALAGIAQWWIGRLLGLGSMARLWAALLAVVAGSITGRMENGLATLVVSTASAALVIPASLALWKKPSARHTVGLAFCLALLAVAGQGYLQLAVALGLLPALATLWIGNHEQGRQFAAHYLRAGVLAALLAGFFLVPLLHQSGQMVKDVDTRFGNAQALEYQPLNLVIRATDFYHDANLDKSPFPYLFFDYIGWVPILLAGLSLRFIPRSQNRLLVFFLTAILLIYLNSSMIIPKLLFQWSFPNFLYGIRHPTLMTGLVTPLILALAAWGLDLVWQRGPQIRLSWGSGQPPAVYLVALLLIVPLAWALISAAAVSENWLYAARQPEESASVMQAAQSGTARWVDFPGGELYWPLLAITANVKVSDAFHPWHFVDRVNPDASLIVQREDAPESDLPVVFSNEAMVVQQNVGVQYATLTTGNGEIIACQAQATGGNIDVTCDAAEPGRLVVSEHAWAGWTAQVDSQVASLVPGQWLMLDVPTGRHQITLRYRPWDAAVGLLLSLIGLGLAVYWWRKEPTGRSSGKPEGSLAPVSEPIA
jgi:hypothetical protein